MESKVNLVLFSKIEEHDGPKTKQARKEDQKSASRKGANKQALALLTYPTRKNQQAQARRNQSGALIVKTRDKSISKPPQPSHRYQHKQRVFPWVNETAPQEVSKAIDN